MKEIDEELVGQIISRIYRDTIVTNSTEYFVKHVYQFSDFDEVTSKETFHSIIGFLPNTNYRGSPFVLSVSFNKRDSLYEITVKNPNAD